MKNKHSLSSDVLQQLLNMAQGVPTASPGEFSKTLRDLLRTSDDSTLKVLTREETFGIGEILIQQGQQEDFLYVILSGRVLVFSGDLHDPLILGIRGVGECLGEMSMIDNAPRSATVVALEPVRVLRIEREAFLRLLQHEPEFTLRLMHLLSQRLRQAEAFRDVEKHSQRLIRRKVNRLVEEKRALEEARQIQQTMINFIVHDLRNPLGIVSNVLEMLEIMLPRDQVQSNEDLFQMGQVAVARMQSLIETLLDTARYEAGQMELMLSEFYVSELLDLVTRMQQIRAQSKAITLTLQAAPQLPSITADQARIERVLANLIDNAIKYTPYGGTIQVSAQVIEQEGTRWIEFRVNDSGPGIPPEARERIFEPFVQLGQSHSGLGLGLNYCRLTVEAHGGKIWVEDGEGGSGSCFVFTLPLTPTAEDKVC